MRKLVLTAAAAGLAALALLFYLVGPWRGSGHGDHAPGRDAGPARPPVTAGPPRGGAGETAPPGELPLRLEDDPIGTLLLEGQVIDAADERPVGGALVSIDAVPRRTIRTEADGSFSFDRLIGRTYRVGASHGDGAAGPVTVRLTDKSEPVILRLKRAASVELLVTDARTRRPIANAAVELRGAAWLTATSGQDGKALVRGVASGWTIVRVTAAGYAPGVTALQVPEAGDAVERQVIALEAGLPVSGTVEDPDGKPVAGAKVRGVPVGSLLALADARDDAVTTDARGRFRLDAASAGTYRFEATHERHAPGLSAPVTLDGRTERTDVVIRLEPEGHLAGRVVARDGTPVAQATVRVAAKGGGILGGAVRQVYTDDRGAFDLQGLPRRAVRVLAIHERGSSSPLVVDLAARPDQTGLELRLDVEGAIAGVVVAPSGAPVPEAQVSAMPALEELGDDELVGLRGVASDVADSGGSFRLTGLKPGRYLVRAAWPGASSERMWLRAGVPAQVGDERVRIVLEPDGRVRGKVRYEDGTAPELFAVGVGTNGAGRTFAGSAGGDFVLNGIPPGDRLLEISGPQLLRKVVDARVAAGDETDVGTITVQRGRSVSGRVLGPDGAPVAAAKVMAGRQLLGDGAKLEAPFGMAGRLGIQETTSGDDGAFALVGVGETALVIAADHPELGRSAVVPIAAGKDSVRLDLALVAPGSLSGKVLVGGKPAAGAIVTAAPQAAAQGTFMVTTSSDGAFRFDRLAPDVYVVTAMLRGQGLGTRMESVVVTVETGRDLSRDIELAGGGVSVVVTVTQAGAKVATAQVILFSGQVSATTGAQLNQLAASRGAGSMYPGFVMKGAPARFENVAPGPYTACAIPIAVDLNDPTALQRLQENVDALPVTCVPRSVAAAPPTQELVVDTAAESPGQ